MSKRYVTLGDGRRVGLGAYVGAWKRILECDPNTRIRGGSLTGWAEETVTAAETLRQFRDGMHDRINRHISGFGVGRKWCSDWYRNAWRACRDVNTPRLIVRYVPPEFRARLAHRLATD